MKYLNFLFLMLFFVQDCKSQKKEFEAAADSIKLYMLTNIPNVKSVDTIYIMPDIVSPREKCIIQGAEYLWASTEAKKIESSDSLLFETKADSILNECDNLDDTTFLFYRIRSLIIYSKKNTEKGIAFKWFFFDKNLKIVPKYFFIKKVANEDGIRLSLLDYSNSEIEKILNYQKATNILKYF